MPTPPELPTNNLPRLDPKALIASLSTRPGVYRMFDDTGGILYVGKAKNLKKRVGNYFRASGLDTKTMALVARIAAIEVTITSNETEALLLEQNLIKQHRPPYNIELRDDKTYPYIMLTNKDEYPRLAFYRGSKKRDATFFGPYPSASAVRESLTILQKVFRVRQCEDSYFRNRSRPCLQYQIERCTGPCVGLISPEDYAQDVHYSTLFLNGKSDTLIKELTQKMENKAEAMEFERAAVIRDQIIDLRRIHEQQYISDQGSDADVLAASLTAAYACVHLIVIRGGRLIGSKSFFPRDKLAGSESALLSAFIASYYLQEDNAANIPRELIIHPAIEEAKALADGLGYHAQKVVKISSAVRGHRAKWLAMAVTNAQQSLQSFVSNKQNVQQRFEQLQQALGLDAMPQRIECFDISHTSGESPVASCVVFDVNGPLKSDYRRFNIEGITGGDDYAAMDQALSRRYARVAKEAAETVEGAKVPDILLIDGGKGQLAQARRVIDECQLASVMLIGIAKGISRRAGQETLFLSTGDSVKEIVLPTESTALHLLQQIRDEAHRFAITGHRQRRAKTRNKSLLEQIPGLGPKRRRELLKHFGGQQEVQRASEDQLAKVTGISKKLAEDIYAYLHNE
ncbi:MAG: excinuclease ABC subunit UvrC [Gammaproteobacteria bacterium]|nr:excinuclease ABC subunit UvrC [Gammaproteobacteria bacterium]MDP2141353.1 excinuclease ABC subunit UvrC [Gammaproteobacteria bacterium]MDP2349060.1 excinuclease ABC subunit UvrC [Gammaproteobacteria bacterium]